MKPIDPRVAAQLDDSLNEVLKDTEPFSRPRYLIELAFFAAIKSAMGKDIKHKQLVDLVTKGLEVYHSAVVGETCEFLLTKSPDKDYELGLRLAKLKSTKHAMTNLAQYHNICQAILGTPE